MVKNQDEHRCAHSHSGFVTPLVNGNAFRDLGGAIPIQVPDPLPLAGASMTFAWSRQRRRRIRLGSRQA